MRNGLLPMLLSTSFLSIHNPFPCPSFSVLSVLPTIALSPADQGGHPRLRPLRSVAPSCLPLAFRVFRVTDPRGLSSSNSPGRSLALPMALFSTRSLVPTLPFRMRTSPVSQTLAPSPFSRLSLAPSVSPFLSRIQPSSLWLRPLAPPPLSGRSHNDRHPIRRRPYPQPHPSRALSSAERVGLHRAEGAVAPALGGGRKQAGGGGRRAQFGRAAGGRREAGAGGWARQRIQRSAAPRARPHARSPAGPPLSAGAPPAPPARRHHCPDGAAGRPGAPQAPRRPEDAAGGRRGRGDAAGAGGAHPRAGELGQPRWPL